MVGYFTRVMDTQKITPMKIEIPECHTNSSVLNLSIKKELSPDYTYSFPSPKYSPGHSDISRAQSISVLETSEKSHLSDVTRYCITPPTSNLYASPRPFKAVPKNALAVNLEVFPNTDPLQTINSDMAYFAFRRRMLSQLTSIKSETNTNMRREQNQNKINRDPSYLENRRKNNEAAKRSRDSRKAKEKEALIRCAYLEQENIQLRFRIAAMEREKEILLAHNNNNYH